MEAGGLKGVIYGATGAVGSQLVKLMLASPRWTKVHCVGRRGLEEWNNLPNKEKLEVQNADMDEYFKRENTHYQSYDAVFCCLGTQVKHGEETFIKIDKTYPLWAADIALKNKIPHYLLVSSMGGDPKSWFLYTRTKGQVEEELKKKGLNLLTILKPGFLKNRANPRFGEKIASYLPFMPGIEARRAAQVMMRLAQKQHDEALKAQGVVNVLENSQMLEALK